MATTTSSKDVRNDNTALVATAKAICGKLTYRNASGRDAPKLRAANSWFMS